MGSNSYLITWCTIPWKSKSTVIRKGKTAIKYIINENWQQGLASSIAKGVSALNSNTQAVMLLLVDQWQLGIDELTLFIRKWQKKPEYIYTASNDTGIKGPPVIFPQHCFSDLSQLKRGHGAKSVIDQHTKILRSIRMPAAFIDLDTPKQLTELKKLYNTN
ncbi:NTP transferase domain-containing protein [Nonlabens dokdonensis]|nr:NTP transferase domain-containing protein [Nonlabens dokdonensis]